MLLSEETLHAAVEAAPPRGVTATLLITTYNRASLLRDTLMCVARLRTPRGVAWDVVVVDNNSTDDTRDVVTEMARSFPVPLSYVFESRQGKSIALNTALAGITSPIVVFSDDDVRVPEEWLENAIRPLIDHPQIGYVGGPVRPLWGASPPNWLRHCGRSDAVLAVLDYGREPFVFEERQLVPLGVNMAVRRRLIEQAGGFHAGLDRSGSALLGQGQAEFFLRCRRAGARGLYVPSMSLEHLVPASRLSVRYFARWWFWKGVSHARWYRMHNETELGIDLTSVRTLLRIPLFMYRSALSNAAAAFRAAVTARTGDLAFHAFMLAYFVGYARECWFGRAPARAEVRATRREARHVAGELPPPPRVEPVEPAAPSSRGRPAHGLRLGGAPKRVIDAALATRGQWLISDWRLQKWEQSCHTRDLFECLGIDCVLDVGGNIGQYQEFLRLHVGYEGHIVSFEPIEELYERLRREKLKDAKWSVHRLALGERHAALPLNVMRERTLSSFLARNEAQLQRNCYEKYLRETEVETTEEVPVRRLDELLDDVLPAGATRVFLKSDTQGYDMAVIAGASGCLEKILALQVELSVRHVYVGSPDYLDALGTLQALGYELTGVFPVQRDSARRAINLDCVMIRRDEAERLHARARRPGGN